MADQVTIGRFVFEFISNSEALKKGNEEASVSSEELARKIERISISNDNLSRKMVSVAQVMGQMGNASEWLASKQNRVADTNEAVAAAMEGLTDKFDEFTESQAKAREEAEKNEKQREKDGQGVGRFTRKLLALAGAYFSVNKIAQGFKGGFATTFDIAKLTELIDVNANSLRNWGAVIEGLGGDRGSAEETFKNISLQLGQIDVSGEGPAILQAANRLGIKIKDQFGKNLAIDDILLNISEALQAKDLDKNQLLFVTSSLGIDENFTRLLSRGPEEVTRLLEEQNAKRRKFNQEELDQVKELQKAWTDVKLAGEDLFIDIGLDNINQALLLLQQVEEIVNNIRGGAPEGMESFGAGDIAEHWLGRLEEFGTEVRKKAGERGFLLERQQEEEYLKENARKFLEMESKTSGSPLTSLQGGRGATFDFRGMTLQTTGANGEQIAAEFTTQVKRIIGREFTGAAETLGDSLAS